MKDRRLDEETLKKIDLIVDKVIEDGEREAMYVFFLFSIFIFLNA
jgi:hypothetical protein